MEQNLQQNIIKELGLDSLPPEKQEEIVLGIGKIIQQKTLLRIIDELSEADKDEFDKLLNEKSNDEEMILNFLKSKIPNLEEIINEEIGKFKQESVDLMRQITA